MPRHAGLLLLDDRMALDLDVPGDREVLAVALQVDERRAQVLLGDDRRPGRGRSRSSPCRRSRGRLWRWRFFPCASAGAALSARASSGDQRTVARNLDNFESFRELPLLSVSAMTLSQRRGDLDACSVRDDAWSMASCCDPRGCDRFFGKRFARRVARRYRKRGLGKTERAMVEYLESCGLDGRDGARGRRRRRRAARRAAQARRRARGQPRAVAGLRRGGAAAARRDGARGTGSSGGCTTSRSSPTPSSRSTSSSCNRVVCCYPDYERLLGAAATHARRALVFSYPRRNALSRAIVSVQNAGFRLTRQEFRVFTHPPRRWSGCCASTASRRGSRAAGWCGGLPGSRGRRRPHLRVSARVDGNRVAHI